MRYRLWLLHENLRQDFIWNLFWVCNKSSSLAEGNIANNINIFIWCITIWCLLEPIYSIRWQDGINNFIQIWIIYIFKLFANNQRIIKFLYYIRCWFGTVSDSDGADGSFSSTLCCCWITAFNASLISFTVRFLQEEMIFEADLIPIWMIRNRMNDDVQRRKGHYL